VRFQPLQLIIHFTNKNYERKYELYQCTSRFFGDAKNKLCWFITQGLNEELALFSRIQDFSQNTEYVMFGKNTV
jgi:hypothetical protein